MRACLACALIMAGCVALRQTWCAARRREQRLRRALSAALAQIAREVQLLLTPLPRLLRRRGRREMADGFCAAVTEKLDAGETLSAAWRAAAFALPLPEEEREALARCGASLDGTAETACASLTLAAGELDRAYERAAAELPARERLATALCLSLGALLCVVLL